MKARSVSASDSLPIMASPPRTVPLTLRRYVWTHPGLVQGSIFFGIATFIAFLFLTPAEVILSLLSLLPSHETSGELTHAGKTASTVNDDRVYRYDYRFHLPDGSLIQGSSYSTNRLDSNPQHNRQVTIQYHPWFPQANCLKEGRPARLGLASIFVYVFPMFGTIAFVYCFRRARLLAYLLHSGLLTEVTITHCQRSEADQPVAFEEFQRLWQQEQDQLARLLQGQSESSRKKALERASTVVCTFELQTTTGETVSESEQLQLTEQLASRPKISVLYDPTAPKRFLFMTEVRLLIEVGQNGEWHVPAQRDRWLLRGLLIVFFVLVVPSLGWFFNTCLP